jgi:hypothetical protein
MSYCKNMGIMFCGSWLRISAGNWIAYWTRSCGFSHVAEVARENVRTSEFDHVVPNHHLGFNGSDADHPVAIQMASGDFNGALDSPDASARTGGSRRKRPPDKTGKSARGKTDCTTSRLGTIDGHKARQREEGQRRHRRAPVPGRREQRTSRSREDFPRITLFERCCETSVIDLLFINRSPFHGALLSGFGLARD